MSFLIAVYVNEGIVLASDRRTTYNNTQVENGILIQKIGIHTIAIFKIKAHIRRSETSRNNQRK